MRNKLFSRIGIGIIYIIFVVFMLIYPFQKDNITITTSYKDVQADNLQVALYWDSGQGYNAQDNMYAVIQNGKAQFSIPVNTFSNASSIRFDPINAEQDIIIESFEVNGRALSFEKMENFVQAFAQLELEPMEDGSIAAYAKGADPQIIFNAEFANYMESTAKMPMLPRVMIIILGTIILGFAMAISFREWIVGTGISLVLWYVLGAIKIFSNLQGKGLQYYVAFVCGIFILGYIIGLYFGYKNDHFQRFSWSEYRGAFVQRYHLNRIDLCILGIALVVGAVLRIVGCNWGLVSIFQPDECQFVDCALDMVEKKSLYQTYSFYYPNQFLSKLAAIVIGIYTALKGTIIDNNTFVEAYFIFRIIVAIFGTLSILVAFLIGNYLKEHMGGILALFVSVSPFYIMLSKQITGDVTVLFFLMLTMLFSLRYMEKKENIFVILMAMGAAMATLEKWHGAIGLGYIGIILLCNERKIWDFIKRGILAVASYVLWLLILAPNVVFNIKSAIIDGFIKIAVYSGDLEEISYGTMLLNYGKYGIQGYGGIVYFLLLIAGIVCLVRNWNRYYLVLLMGVLKTFILCFMNRQALRWGLELYLVEFVLVALAIISAMNHSKKVLRWGGTIAGCIALAEFVAAGIGQMVVSACSENDTRFIQRADCKELGITVDNSIFEDYTGFAPGGWCDKEYGDAGQLYTYWSEYFTEQDGKLYKKQEDIDYVMLNADNYGYKWVNIFMNYCDNYRYYEPMYGEVFMNSSDPKEWEWNDFAIIYQNIQMIQDLKNGAYTGRHLYLFDVREIPYME